MCVLFHSVKTYGSDDDAPNGPRWANDAKTSRHGTTSFCTKRTGQEMITDRHPSMLENHEHFFIETIQDSVYRNLAKPGYLAL